MTRTYLFVPPEEKADAQALGAHWDADSKRWYIGSQEAPQRFSRWLPSADEDEEFTIVSDQANVAAARIPCYRCQADIKVICIYCESGTVMDEPLTRFTVSDVWALDHDLTRQLKRWPDFRPSGTSETGERRFANHCPQCGAVQEDIDLHAEPGAPFFDIPATPPGTITLTPLTGTVRLSGDEHFEV